MSSTTTRDALQFSVPIALRASEPPEARGVPRDRVRMMVAQRHDQSLRHVLFCDLPDLLGEDDLVVVNTSATLAAAAEGRGTLGGGPVMVNFSTHLSTEADGRETWAVEPRRLSGGRSQPWAKAGRGQGAPPVHIELPPAGGARGQPAYVVLRQPYRDSPRLWLASVAAPGEQGMARWLAQHGRPVRYDYVSRPWPLDNYQTVFASEPGSAEMPSAGRPFSAQTVLALVARGVGMAPVVLHTGVSSLEAGELPYPEHAYVPAGTARRVNATRRAGGRVVAVGTTVVRALESAFDPGQDAVAAFDGWTDLVVTPERGVRTVDGLITGWHEPEASHLLMLEAVAGRPLLEKAYQASLAQGYLWHEFGDVALFLP